MYQDFSDATDSERLHARLYEGAIARFCNLGPMRELVAFTQDFLERRLAPHPPVQSHRHFEPQALAQVYAQLRREFARTDEAQRLWRAVFAAAGLDPDLTARDRLILRFQPPHLPGRERPWARSTATLGFHRDTWGTNLYAQINWWAPVYPLDVGRTMLMFPHLFAQPLANSSAGFDIVDVMRRTSEAPETVKAGETIPHLMEALDWSQGIPVLIAPGEIIAFSAQHAHATVRNLTDMTRISMDTRTLRIPDHLAGRGARNVDGRARCTTPRMFKRLSDDKPLPEVLQIQGLQRYEPGHTEAVVGGGRVDPPPRTTPALRPSGQPGYRMRGRGALQRHRF
ncbi:MAG TPA: hypothetical protein VGG49_05755 [Steroidobacteraceae bacterium]|jgi:hypothetical protein